MLNRFPKKTELRLAGEILSLAAAYLITAKLGLMLGAVSHFATLVWPPTGLALSALLIGGFRVWPGIALGALAVNLWTGAPLLVASGIATGNTLESVAAAYVLKRWFDFGGSFDRLGLSIGLVGVAGSCTMISATFGVLSLFAGGIVTAANLFDTWRAWWIGDALGLLIVVPLITSWPKQRLRHNSLFWFESFALFFSLIGVGLILFAAWRTAEHGLLGEAYLFFPLLLWAALRFDVPGASRAAFLVSAICVAGTALGMGPFVRHTLSQSLLHLQVFMSVAVTTTLVLGAAIAERRDAIRRREEVLAAVSHDLRGPLNTISLASTLLLHSRPAEAMSESWRKQVELVERSAARMTVLVQDILQMGALDARHMVLTRAPTEGQEIVRQSVELMQPLARDKELSLAQVLPNAPLYVFCDPARVLQVMSNLLDNALKFTPRGGQITVGIERVEAAVRFWVSDTGRGLEPAQVKHVFEKYWRAPSAEASGIGLGLSIAKAIVTAHSGTIWAESAPDGGARFCFTLPPLDAKVPAAPDAGLGSKDIAKVAGR